MMTGDQILKYAMLSFTDVRDAIVWAVKQEREQCARVCDEAHRAMQPADLADLIRQRNL